MGFHRGATMPTGTFRAVFLLWMLFTLGCGGGDDGPVNPGNGNTGGGGGPGSSWMTATIGGVPWAASKNFLTVGGDPQLAYEGYLAIAGFNGSFTTGVTMNLSFVSGPGTYPLGVNFSTNAGGDATVADGITGWGTRQDGKAGEVTITIRTATRVAGTFQFTAWDPIGGRPDIEVTDGAFDITVPTGLPALPTGEPNVVAATIDGAEWEAALSVYTATVSGPVLQANNIWGTEGYGIMMWFPSTISVGGTYAIGPDVGVFLSRGDSNTWGYPVAGPDSVGSVTITTLNSGRIEGTFSATLPPAMATGPITLENGLFSVRIYQDETLRNRDNMVGAAMGSPLYSKKTGAAPISYR